MKKRIVKKWAKAFLTGRKSFPIRKQNHILDTDGNYVVKVEYILPERVYREVREMALSCGWDGCHWDAPELIGCHDQEGWHPNTRWFAAKVEEKWKLED